VRLDFPHRGSGARLKNAKLLWQKGSENSKRIARRADPRPHRHTRRCTRARPHRRGRGGGSRGRARCCTPRSRSSTCLPGRKPPFLAVARPVCPHKTDLLWKTQRARKPHSRPGRARTDEREDTRAVRRGGLYRAPDLPGGRVEAVEDIRAALVGAEHREDAAVAVRRPRLVEGALVPGRAAVYPPARGLALPWYCMEDSTVGYESVYYKTERDCRGASKVEVISSRGPH
jgi:hypothetical protein